MKILLFTHPHVVPNIQTFWDTKQILKHELIILVALFYAITMHGNWGFQSSEKHKKFCVILFV